MQARTLITLGKMSLSHLKKSIKKDSGYCFLKSLQLRGGGCCGCCCWLGLFVFKNTDRCATIFSKFRATTIKYTCNTGILLLKD